MRIGSEAPKRRTHSSNRHESQGTGRGSATSNHHRRPVTSERTRPKLSRTFSILHSLCRTQNDAVRYNALPNEPAQGDQKLARQGHDHGLSTPEGETIPPNTLAELCRDMERRRTHPAKTTGWVAFDRVMRLKQPLPRRSAEANSKAEVRRCAWRGDLASGRACRRAKLADRHH